jgi:hypothetical protein
MGMSPRNPGRRNPKATHNTKLIAMKCRGAMKNFRSFAQHARFQPSSALLHSRRWGTMRGQAAAGATCSEKLCMLL